MDTTEVLSEKTESHLNAEKLRLKAQVAVIQNQLGSLELVRARLGLSQRKMTQLLMVDPSCWSRWVRKPESVPPSVWRSLQWYMALSDKIPGLSPQYFIGGTPGTSEKELENKLAEEKKLRESWNLHVGQQLEHLNDEIIAQNQIIFENQKNFETESRALKKQIRFWKMSSVALFVLGLFFIRWI